MGFLPTRQESPSRSCNPVSLRLRVDRVSWSRSSEWRNARDTPAPEIPPATRTDGSIVDFPARFVSDCKSTGTWNKRLDTDLFPSGKADQDTVYEQDLLRNPGSIKPWLAYIEYKQQNGTLYEQAFVSRLGYYPFSPLLNVF
jgi:hypothetical protein